MLMEIPFNNLMLGWILVVLLFIGVIYYYKKVYAKDQTVKQQLDNYKELFFQPLKFPSKDNDLIKQLRYIQAMFGRPIRATFGMDGKDTWLEFILPFDPESESAYNFHHEKIIQSSKKQDKKKGRSEIG